METLFKFKYWIHERVKIKELDVYGLVEEVSVGQYGDLYEVRYFNNGELKRVNFIPQELDKAKENKDE